uniref:Uncharacterized protein n=1 Tax=Biomphalaria glabrata TaxID=6526 RepID=A0A2C9L2B7_BIOGL
ATRNVARNLLEACAGNLDMAVGMHMDNDGVGPAVPETIPESLCNESDNVRAPIPQKTEVLIEDDPGVAGTSFTILLKNSKGKGGREKKKRV